MTPELLWDDGFEPDSAAAKRPGRHIIYGDVIYGDVETVLLLTTTIRIRPMTFRAPIDDIVLALNQGGGLLRAVRDGHYGGYDVEMTAAVLEEAGRFAEDVLAPLNAVGDKNGVKIADGKVTTPPGWPDAYRRWSEAGWNAVAGSEEWGGQGLPLAINFACTELWSAANMAFGLCPLLTASAIEALEAHGTERAEEDSISQS